jgi:hypothetical protein
MGKSKLLDELAPLFGTILAGVAVALAFFYLYLERRIVSGTHAVPLGISIIVVVGAILLIILAHKHINGAIHLFLKVSAILALYTIIAPFAASAICNMQIRCNLTIFELALLAIMIADVALTIKEGREYNQPIFPKTSIKPFNISGPPMFMTAVDQLMQELELRDPNSYETMTKYMKQIVHYSQLKVAADSRGVFKLDGNDYEALRYMILHELGHSCGHHDEGSADRFADNILERIGAAPFKRTTKLSCKVVS